MSKPNYKYLSPRLRTVNIELRDVEYYLEKKKLNVEELDFDFSFRIELKNSKLLQIFIHLQFAYPEDKLSEGNKEQDLFIIYHSDHIIDVVLEKQRRKNKTFDVDYLAHLLGTSIVMTKGYFDNITRGYLINEFALPIFNPTELINFKFKDALTSEATVDFDLVNDR